MTEILALRPVQRADSGPAPSRRADPSNLSTNPGEVPTVAHNVLYRVPEAMAILRLGRTAIYEQIRSGRLRSVKQGRARRVPASAIADYVALLERESGLVAA